MLPYRYRVVKYDAARRFGEVDDWTSIDDIGCEFEGVVLTEAEYLRVEQVHLGTVRDAAAASGVDHFEIREPQAAETTAYHDGAVVDVDEALEILRGILREDGFDCRLEAPGRMYVHVGWDYYMYVGSCVPCAKTLASHGLHVDELTSLRDVEGDVQVEHRPADEAFWREAAGGGPALLAERWGGTSARWHRLIPSTVDAVRSRLVPRAVLAVHPADLDVPPAEALARAVRLWDTNDINARPQVVWQDHDGVLHGDDAIDAQGLREFEPRLATAVAAAVLQPWLPGAALEAAVPDADGLVHLRGHRWGPEFGHRVTRADAVAALHSFAAECRVQKLAIREPAFLGTKPNPSWYDGKMLSTVDVTAVVEAVLTGGFWCRLELRNEMYVHIGRAAVWIGTRTACPTSGARFDAVPEKTPLDAGHQLLAEYRTADDLFWQEVSDAKLVEEHWAHGATRVHDLTHQSLESVRENLLPRAVVHVYRTNPPQDPPVVAALPDPDGTIRLRHEPAGDPPWER
jgi:small subunit ribosomal protein S1